MKKWKLLTILMAMMLLVLAACGSKDEAKEEDKGTSTDKPAEEKNEASAAYPITIPGSTIEGRDGKTTFEEVKLDKIPEKVVVFDNGFLDTLDALGVNPLQ